MSFGLEISSQGVPLDTAGDFQKVLDTRWPVLEIYQDIPLNITATIAATGWVGNVVTLATHNLNHPAAFEFFPAHGLSPQVTKAFGSDAGFEYAYPGLGFSEDFLIQSDEAGIYLTIPKFSGDPTYTVQVKGLLRIYKNDITQQFKADVEGTSSTPAQNTNQGARIVKDGHQISDTTTADFKLNTDARMIGVQSTGLQAVDPSTGKLVITHDAGYRPTYYTAYYDTHPTPNVFGGIYPDPFYGKNTLYPLLQFFTFAFADAHTITMRGVQAALAGTYAYLILKDPVDLGI